MNRVALSLSGSGHLLVYHLGVCSALLEHKIPVSVVAGSSGGAIAAAVMAYAPSRLEEFALEFSKERGKGLSLLEKYLASSNLSRGPDRRNSPTIDLHVCTTRNNDGTANVFQYPTYDPSCITTIKASCTFPTSFHPVDLLFPSRPQTYPDGSGVCIDGVYYCDGGIAAPAPPTPDHLQRIVVSPIAGSASSSAEPRISPSDNSLRLLPLSNIRVINLPVRPSLQNLRALRVASGAASTTELMDWYDQGSQDATAYVSSMRGEDS